MAATGAVLIGGSLALGAREQRKARKDAQAAAEEERRSVEALQREIQAESEATPMPTANDSDVRRARRTSIAQQMRRRGRRSTILTSDATADPLG
jgi:hypothetical protein